jgi:hypothetical protein
LGNGCISVSGGLVSFFCFGVRNVKVKRGERRGKSSVEGLRRKFSVGGGGGSARLGEAYKVRGTAVVRASSDFVW